MLSIMGLEKFRNNKIKLFCLFIFSIAVLFLAGCDSDKKIEVVQGGTFTAYPNVPIGKAFGSYFKDGTWNTVKEGDFEYTVYKGNYTKDNQEFEIEIYFKLEGEDKTTFEFAFIKLDDSKISIWDAKRIIDTAMRTYKGK